MLAEAKTLPVPTPLTLPYWQACREGRLLLQRCAACGHRQFYPRVICTQCGSEQLAWFDAAGRGRVKSFTVIRQAVSAAYAADVPYIVALIGLAEGPTMMSNVVGCAPEEIRIGAAVRLSFAAWSAEISMPVFTLE